MVDPISLKDSDSRRKYDDFLDYSKGPFTLQLHLYHDEILLHVYYILSPTIYSISR